MVKKINTKKNLQTLFEEIKEEFSCNESKTITLDTLYKIIEYLHGQYISKNIMMEWEISSVKDMLKMWEVEHGKSLALLFENEAQKSQLENLNKKLSESIHINERDMKMAAKVQSSLLYQSPPDTNNFDIAFHYEPFASVSGDFYDFYVTEENILKGMVLADVSGHGIASSLLTVLAKPIFFRIFRDNHEDKLNTIMSKINKHLIADMEGSENFITAALLRFKGSSVEYVNAAHPNLILRSFKKNTCKLIGSDNMNSDGSILGASSINTPFSIYDFSINKNDFIVLYTDCLIESKNHKGAQFGQKTLRNMLNLIPDTYNSQEILEEILTYFKAHIDYRPITDDLSIIVLKKY